MIDETHNRPSAGIATDGAHSTRKSRTRFRGVDLVSGEVIFSEEVGNRTSNVGEFLGVVAAARYILRHHHVPQIIYTDSTTAITWYQNKHAATRRRCPALLRAEVFLRIMTVPLANVQVRHWNTQCWGEIPADYGEK